MKKAILYSGTGMMIVFFLLVLFGMIYASATIVLTFAFGLFFRLLLAIGAGLLIAWAASLMINSLVEIFTQDKKTLL